MFKSAQQDMTLPRGGSELFPGVLSVSIFFFIKYFSRGKASSTATLGTPDQEGEDEPESEEDVFEGGANQEDGPPKRGRGRPRKRKHGHAKGNQPTSFALRPVSGPSQSLSNTPQENGPPSVTPPRLRTPSPLPNHPYSSDMYWYPCVCKISCSFSFQTPLIITLQLFHLCRRIIHCMLEVNTTRATTATRCTFTHNRQLNNLLVMRDRIVFALNLLPRLETLRKRWVVPGLLPSLFLPNLPIIRPSLPAQRVPVRG